MGKVNKIIEILSLVAIIITAFFVGFILFTNVDENFCLTNISYITNIYNKNKPIISSNSLPKNNKIPIKLLFFGDMMLDRHVGEKISKYGLNYLFENIATTSNGINFIDYHLVSCNLEGAVTNNGEHYLPNMSYDFAFEPELINQLKDYNFNFFNIANNHLADQGERGIIETRQNLDKLGYNYAGCQDGEVGSCSSTIIEIAGQKIGMAGFSIVYTKFDNLKAEKEINELSSTTDLVIVNMHWGVEYEHYYNKTQQEIAHKLIEAGADIIIGHHPHVVQGIEIYEFKRSPTNAAHPNNRKGIIFYSLGNFIFDQYFSSDTQEGLAAGINIINEEVIFSLIPIKSKLSQVELMAGDEKEIFLNKLISWSEVDEEYDEQILKGQIKTP
ncbi:MAG: CapA family protein [Patescibacteria group bacterium]